jgi:hypothetical protein
MTFVCLAYCSLCLTPTRGRSVAAVVVVSLGCSAAAVRGHWAFSCRSIPFTPTISFTSYHFFAAGRFLEFLLSADYNLPAFAIPGSQETFSGNGPYSKQSSERIIV